MKRLDNAEIIKKYDKKNYCHNIIHMPQNIFWGYDKCKINLTDTFEAKKYERVVIFSSANDLISAKLIKEAFHKIAKISVFTIDTKVFYDRNDLVILLDYNLSDDNSLKIYNSFAKIECDFAIISTEKLELTKNSMQVVLNKMEKELALPYTFTALIKVLESYKIIPSQADEIKSVIASLITRAGALAEHVDTNYNFGKLSAEKLENKIPFFVAENRDLENLALIWQKLFSKRVKTITFYGVNKDILRDKTFPLMLDKFDNLLPVIIKRFNEKSKNRKYTDELLQLVSTSGKNFLEFFVEGNSIITEYFSLIYLAEITSSYVAILNEKDPSN
jgi:glucose/mannose-6-phosphate isomerase